MLTSPVPRRVQRWLLSSWIITFGSAVCALGMGVFWWWIIFIVTVPAVYFASVAPTLAIYLTALLLPFLLWRTWGGLIAGAVLAGFLAFAAPAIMNAAIERRLADAVGKDFGPLLTQERLGTVALLSSQAPYCSADCERLLASGRAQAVIIGPPDALDRPRPLTRITVQDAENGNCSVPFTGRNEIFPRRWIAKSFGEGRCPVFQQGVRLADADFAVRSVGSWGRTKLDDHIPRLDPRVSRDEVFVSQNGRWAPVLRRTRAEAWTVAAPLKLRPMQGADTIEAARWERAEERRVGKGEMDGLRNLLSQVPRAPCSEAPGNSC